MLATSCSSDPDFTDTGGDGILSGREMNFALRFRYDRNMTRATTTVGTDAEKCIDNLRVVLYEGKSVDVDGITQPDPDAVVLYSFDFYIQSKDDFSGFKEWSGTWPSGLEYGENEHLSPSTPADGTQFITYARKVQDRNYYMLVLLNANVENDWRDGSQTTDPAALRLRNTTKIGCKLSDFTQAIQVAVEDITNKGKGGPAANNFFLMTNADGLVYVPASKLATNAQGAHDAPVSARVERAVAKVEIKKDPAIAIPAEFELGNISWDLVNSNKYFYWMRKPTFLIDPAGTAGAHELAGTPVSDRATIYAEDPNFADLSTANGGTVTQRKAHFNTAEELFYDDVENRVISPTVLKNYTAYTNISAGSTYTLENTMKADDQSPEVITQVLCAIPIVAEATNSWHDADRTRTQYGYFVFKDMLITAAEMKGYASNYGSIPLPSLAGLEDAIEAVKNDSGIAIDFTTLGDSPTSEDNNHAFDEYGLRYYKYGVNYFTALIQHYDGYSSTTPADAYGRFGIVRNNQYTVNITEITGFGSPVVTKPSYISAEVEILAWMMHMQEDEVGEEVGDLNKTPIVTIKYYYDNFGPYNYTNIATRAPGDRFGWHEVLFRTDFIRMPVGTTIPDDDMALLNKYKDDIPVVGMFSDGISDDLPCVVSEYDDVISVRYFQIRANVDVYYLDKNDLSNNLWDIYWGHEYNNLEVPHGYKVVPDSPNVRFYYDDYNGDIVYYENAYYYHNRQHFPYSTFDSSDKPEVIADAYNPQTLTLYFTMKSLVFLVEAEGDPMYRGHILGNSVTGFKQPTVVHVDTNGELDVSALTKDLTAKGYALRPANDRYHYGDYYADDPYVYNDGEQPTPGSSEFKLPHKTNAAIMIIYDRIP